MFYLLVMLSIVVFTVHLVLLDRTQKFRLTPFQCNWRTFGGSFYRRDLYAADARALLRWVYWSAGAWLLLIVLTGLAVNKWELWRLAGAVPIIGIALFAFWAGFRR